ncbi:glycosyltransferase family 9 protein [Bauldia sp.]|uniref:glycosyltransferase family 9 protein n=1 Tax=Bauldia sp. TaxID=2575872 RepID=UPI003BABB446
MPQPAPPDSLGNPTPPYAMAMALPDAVTPRQGLVVDGGPNARLPVDLARCRRILVVRLDFIGDWVLTTPFLANLRASAPDAEITVVVLNRVFDLARSCAFVDRVIGVEPAAAGPVSFYAADQATLASFIADYGNYLFDLALVPRWDTDFNSALRIADGSGAATVIGFSEANTAHRRANNRGDDRFYSAILRDTEAMHEVDHKLGLLAAMGGTTEQRDLTLHLDPADKRRAAEFLVKRLGGADRFIAIAPFAVPRKQVPPERSAVLANRLSETLDLPVVVVGSPVHAPNAAAFLSELKGPAASAVGLPLGASAALIGRASMLIGMDSGPAHIAAALNTPVAVIFNHARSAAPDHVGSPERFAPWGEPSRVLVLRPDEPLAPCTDGCEVDAAHCITQLDVDDLYPPIADFAARFVAVRDPVFS